MNWSCLLLWRFQSVKGYPAYYLLLLLLIIISYFYLLSVISYLLRIIYLLFPYLSFICHLFLFCYHLLLPSLLITNHHLLTIIITTIVLISILFRPYHLSKIQCIYSTCFLSLSKIRLNLWINLFKITNKLIKRNHIKWSMVT